MMTIASGPALKSLFTLAAILKCFCEVVASIKTPLLVYVLQSFQTFTLRQHFNVQ